MVIKMELEMQVQDQGQSMGRSLPHQPGAGVPAARWLLPLSPIRDSVSVLKEQGRPSSEKRTFSPELWWRCLAQGPVSDVPGGAVHRSYTGR